MKYYTNEEITKRKIKFENRIEKIKLIAVILISIIVILNLIIIFKALLVPNKTPSIFGVKTFSIISGSMMPELNVGDIIIVKEVDNFKINDIITFRQNDKMITHRIIDITKKDNEEVYITKGDNNNVQDEGYVEPRDIEGKVINKIPLIGYITIFLQKKEVLAIIFTVFCLSYIHDIKVNNKKNLRRQKREILNDEKKIKEN